ncbi:hypothetical protein L207DRAFT_594097 [Hyaloscypha variabilis F]|uniref:Uncharacterized protein n=1 Tax=Hyaloscypha variabilis (strain UAMH 11265 / GT02V1 / F) TaxID=1149755 RepID=A0A2J6QR82_HYAVF|nr:hypothetical protein L207DRAFT_594097 [Hyaloscypha variabilis F]
MSKLSKALKRLKGKLKETKDESASPKSSDPNQSSGVPWKTSPPQLPAQSSQKPNSISNVTSVEGLRQARIQKLSSHVSASTVAPPQPIPQCVPIKVPTETPKSEPQHEQLDTEEIKDESLIPTAPKDLAQPSSSGETLAVNPQPEPTVTATKAIPHPSPLLIQPTFTTPKATSRRTPQAKQYAPKPASKSVPIPAVQRQAGLYSGFTPEVAAIDQPTPAVLYNAKKTASGVLLSGASPSYARQDDYTDLIPIPSYSSYATPSPYSSSKPLGTFHTGGAIGGGHSSTGGAIGEGAVSHTAGWLGEGSVSQTGGSLGEAVGVQPPAPSVGLVRPLMPPPRLPVLPRNTSSDPEAIMDRIVAILKKSGRSVSVLDILAGLDEESYQEVTALMQEYCLAPQPDVKAETSRDPFAPGPSKNPFAPGPSKHPLGLGRGGPSAQAQQQSQKDSTSTQREPWESLYEYD